MTIRRFQDPAGRRIAIYDVPNNLGHPDDPNAPQNAPLVDPENNLQHVFFHSDLDPMEVAFGPLNATITHPTIAAGAVGGGGVAGVNGSRVYGGHAADHLLLQHDLGYVPDFFCVLGANAVHPGFPLQYDPADGRARCVTVYATATQIRLYEVGVQTSNAMGGLNATYTLVVLKQPPAPVGNVLFDFDPVSGLVRMAFEKFRSDRRYLQVVAGGSPFGIPLGRTLDLQNGAPRSVGADGAVRDIVPPSFQISFGSGVPNYGPSGAYNGSFAGDPVVLVQAP